METRMYTIWDSLAAESGPLFCAQNDAVAIRHFKQLVQGVFTPNDFVLYCVGAYDSSTMEVRYFGPDKIIVMLDKEVKHEISN